MERESRSGKEKRMNTKSQHERMKSAFASRAPVNQALTARMEKRALQWMAERAPMWVSSDQLTVLGLSAQIGAGICYALSRYDRRDSAAGDCVPGAELAG
jgi:archaetidylinositol phosphate synthase